MPDLLFSPLDEAAFQTYLSWFADAELERRVDMPTEQWLRYVSTGDSCFAWLISERELPVGMLQLDTMPDRIGSVLLVVNPALRSRGYGKHVLQTFLARPETSILNKIEAWIEADNAASLRCFQSVGFTLRNIKPDSHNLLVLTYQYH